jgi:2-dehydropantoate 2-reductase
VLCARRPVDGLSLQSSDGWTIDIAAPVVTEPDRLAPADWVLLAVKAHQARGTKGWLRRLCGAGTTVVVLQNGIEQRESVRGRRARRWRRARRREQRAGGAEEGTQKRG